LASLENMAIGENQLTGTISTHLGALTVLKVLSLLYDGLSGPVPSEFGMLQSLESMVLGGNRLSGSIPTELGSL
jgi:hypothetical protein